MQIVLWFWCSSDLTFVLSLLLFCSPFFCSLGLHFVASAPLLCGFVFCVLASSTECTRSTSLFLNTFFLLSAPYFWDQCFASDTAQYEQVNTGQREGEKKKLPLFALYSLHESVTSKSLLFFLSALSYESYLAVTKKVFNWCALFFCSLTECFSSFLFCTHFVGIFLSPFPCVCSLLTLFNLYYSVRSRLHFLFFAFFW